MSSIEERIETHKQLAMNAEKRYTFHKNEVARLEAKQEKKVN